MYSLKHPLVFRNLSEAAKWDHILHWHRHSVARGIHWFPWPLSGAVYEHPICPCHRSEIGIPVQCSGSEGDDWPCSSIPTAYRSDRYGHAISRLDRLIVVKAIISLRLPFYTYLYPSVLLHPDALIPFLYYIARISRHAVIWTRLIPVILWGVLIVTVASLGFLWVFN